MCLIVMKIVSNVKHLNGLRHKRQHLIARQTIPNLSTTTPSLQTIKYDFTGKSCAFFSPFTPQV